MSQDVGRTLYRAGWTQGVLLNPIAVSVAFAPDQPVSKIAKAAIGRGAPDASLKLGHPHGIASGVAASTERLVVVSQACDIVKSPNDEPNILAMPVFKTENQRIIGPASRNSSRYYLLDAGRGFIVDASAVAVIEKPLLMTMTPEVGALTEDDRKRFGRWLARRFNRPAIDDDVVVAIVKPILENMRALQAAGNLDPELFDQIAEVRLLVENDSLPFTFDLLFMVEAIGSAEFELLLAPLLGQMRSWFQPELSILRAWYTRTYEDVSVADYLASEQLYLDEYSYEGGTIRGLIAPEPI